MDRSTPTESRHPDSLHDLFDRPRQSAGVRRADPEAIPGDPYGAIAAAEQAQETLKLPPRDDGVLSGRALH